MGEQVTPPPKRFGELQIKPAPIPRKIVLPLILIGISMFFVGLGTGWLVGFFLFSPWNRVCLNCIHSEYSHSVQVVPTKQVAPGTASPIKKTVTNITFVSPQSFFKDLPPLPNGAVWSIPKQDTVTWNYKDAAGRSMSMLIQGYASRASAFFTPTDEKTAYPLDARLYVYSGQKRISQGWSLDVDNYTSMNTGDVNSNASFVQSNEHTEQIIQAGYSEYYKRYAPDPALMQCPCSYIYKLFLSDPFPVPH